MGEVKKKTRVSEGAVLPVSSRIKTAVESLREFVDNFNTTSVLALRGGTFHELSNVQVYTTRVDGWEFGYKLVELPADFFLRKVFVKVHGAKLDEVAYKEVQEVLSSVFAAALDIGAPSAIEQIADDCLLVTQQFQVIAWKENNPNLLVPGNPASKAAIQ